MSEKENNNILNLTNDYIFKKVFGSTGNEEITKNLLEAVLNCKIKTVNLEQNPILPQDFKNDKYGVLDMKAVLDDNILCDIEMQVVPYENLAKRIIYYWAKLYVHSVHSGEDYDFLKRTVAIMFIDFDFSKIDRSLDSFPEFHTKWHIHEDNYSTYVLSDVLEIHIVSLKALEKLTEKGYNKEEKLINWIKFMKNPKNSEAGIMKNKYIKEANVKFEELMRNEREREIAERRMMQVMEIKSIEKSGYNRGVEAGIKQGTEAGKKERNIEIAKKLLDRNTDIQTIIELTDLSKEEIEKLK